MLKIEDTEYIGKVLHNLGARDWMLSRSLFKKGGGLLGLGITYSGDSEFSYTLLEIEEGVAEYKKNLPYMEKTEEIKKAYDNELKTGRIETGLGFAADSRYSAEKNDIMVLELALKRGDTTYFIDADNKKHSTTKVQFESILEKVETALSDRIKKKHTLLAQIKTATVEELKDIAW